MDVYESTIRNQQSEIFNGFICPGFINAHCHLELSYMKGMIGEKTGLAGFIKEILQKRNSSNHQQMEKAISDAEAEMIKNGIVAVGDISNDDSTYKQKAKQNLFYHTFIEVFDLNPSKAKDFFHNALELQSAITNHPSSIVPHAPYSVSFELLKLIAGQKNNPVLSIHNQETKSENELFESKTGELLEMFNTMNVSLEHLQPTGKSSLQSYLPKMPVKNKTLLVHNIFTGREDIQFAHSYSKNIYWCFCPNANMYIENKLPGYELFIREKAKCCIGTDSYASNWSLSILDEIKTITKHKPEIPLQMLLEWATINGSEVLGIENQFGSIEKDKRPGLNLIENIDFQNMRLTGKSAVRKII